MRAGFDPAAALFHTLFTPIGMLPGLACFLLAKSWNGRFPFLWAGLGGAVGGVAWFGLL